MSVYWLSRRKLLIVAGSLTLTSTVGSVLALEKLKKEEGSKYKWAMLVDVEKCTECIKERGKYTKPPCVVACDMENNVPEFDDPLRDPQWIKIVELKPETGGESIFIPLMCNHCEYPACAQVCLSKATYKRPDGIVVIDYHRCIGCRYCIIACPYGSRSFNWFPPEEGLEHINRETQTRGHGIVEKCTFCVHRVDKEVNRAELEGRKPKPVPACVEACHRDGKGSLVFGNLLDEESEIYKIVKEGKVITLRPEFGTKPHVFYKL